MEEIVIMLSERELIALAVSLPPITSIEVTQNEDGTYSGWFNYHILMEFPDGSIEEIVDYDGATPCATREEALVNTLVGACLEFEYLPDGTQGWLFDLAYRVDEGKPVTCYDCKGPATRYETAMELDIDLDKGLANGRGPRTETLRFAGGYEVICPVCGESDGEPPQYVPEWE
jgi:hypothetical protein